MIRSDNQFTVGKVSIDLDEPGFKPEEQTKIEPGKEIKKDPQIKNTGVNDAFVYLEVSVPTAECGSGMRKMEQDWATRDQELFSFQPSDKLDKIEFQEKMADTQVYVYAYNKILEARSRLQTHCLIP